jgi:hypothetical protein
MIRQGLKLLYRLGECRRAWRILEVYEAATVDNNELRGADSCRHLCGEPHHEFQA